MKTKSNFPLMAFCFLAMLFLRLTEIGHETGMIDQRMLTELPISVFLAGIEVKCLRFWLMY